MSKKKNKFYVVWKGVQPGIYRSWQDCQEQTVGFAGAKFKAFDTLAAAENAFQNDFSTHIGNKSKQSVLDFNLEENPNHKPDLNTISVDAACSGNPGEMEYQGVITKTGEQIFHKKFALGTNNIGEFLAIVHCLAQQKKDGTNIPIYSDSKIAINWVQLKKCKTELEKSSQTQELYQIISRAENWLKANSYDIKILKWDTRAWGEIPADFGRK